MSGKSKIEWTDVTWNPVRGCSKVSPGCEKCYAKPIAERFGGVNGFDLRLIPEQLTKPFRLRKPKKIFMCSMSDLFHEKVPDDYIQKVVQVMLEANWHTYQVLTKRSKRMRHLLNTQLRFAADYPHIWWGVSVENVKHGFPRIADLQEAPVKGRFLSIEPLLEPLDGLNLDGIGWVIVGGESGPGARPMHKDWVISIRDQCRTNNVPFFFKQWGGVRKYKTGRMLDGQTYDEFPH